MAQSIKRDVRIRCPSQQCVKYFFIIAHELPYIGEEWKSSNSLRGISDLFSWSWRFYRTNHRSSWRYRRNVSQSYYIPLCREVKRYVRIDFRICQPDLPDMKKEKRCDTDPAIFQSAYRNPSKIFITK